MNTKPFIFNVFTSLQYSVGGTLQVVVARHVSQPVHCSAPAITTMFSIAKAVGSIYGQFWGMVMLYTTDMLVIWMFAPKCS